MKAEIEAADIVLADLGFASNQATTPAAAVFQAGWPVGYDWTPMAQRPPRTSSIALVKPNWQTSSFASVMNG